VVNGKWNFACVCFYMLCVVAGCTEEDVDLLFGAQVGFHGMVAKQMQCTGGCV
jgi:hypothetical protein